MIYRAIGLHCGSYTYGFDIAQIQFHENAGSWTFEIIHADHISYSVEWQQRLQQVSDANVLDYLLPDKELGLYLANAVTEFIDKYQLHFKVQLIGVKGYSVCKVPQKKLDAFLGNGAAISAITAIPVVSDFNNIDLALGGNGGPLIAAHQLLFNSYNYCLDVGETVTLTTHKNSEYHAVEICAGITVLQNLLGFKDATVVNQLIDAGAVHPALLATLNSFDWNSTAQNPVIGSDTLAAFTTLLGKNIDGLSLEDVYCSYWEYLTQKIKNSLDMPELPITNTPEQSKLMITGTSGLPAILAEKLQQRLASDSNSVELASAINASFNMATQWALCGLLRWRDEYNYHAGVTGASRSSIGGALWMGAEA